MNRILYKYFIEHKIIGKWDIVNMLFICLLFSSGFCLFYLILSILIEIAIVEKYPSKFRVTENEEPPNPLHLIMFMLVMFPFLYAMAPSDISYPLIAISILLYVKSLTKEDMMIVKDSIPKFNLFHIVMFIIISAPLLFVIYGLLFKSN